MGSGSRSESNSLATEFIGMRRLRLDFVLSPREFTTLMTPPTKSTFGGIMSRRVYEAIKKIHRRP
jgi:hypothetical protein